MQAGTALAGRRVLAVFTAVCMVISVFLVFADRAQADHIPPTGPFPNNCVEFGVGEAGPQSPSDFPNVSFGVNEWANTPGDPHLVEFTVSGLGEGEYVDISVKMGQTIEEDGPFYNGTHTILSQGQGISHVRMCVLEQSVESGKIVIRKQVTEGSDTTVVFDFEASYEAGSPAFSLADGEESDTDVAPGTYSVTESTPEGWELVSATCDDGSDPSAINVSPGETVTCTFLNNELPPEPGTIVVVKEVTDGSDTSQEFTFTESGFTLDDNTLAHGESGSASVTAGGDYSVSETIPDGWSLQSATCDSTDEADDSTPADINVSSGETVTCTFVNNEIPDNPTPPGTIVVVKEVTDGSDTSQEFTFTESGFTLDDNTLAHGESGSASVTAGGDYSVSETIPDGWSLQSATCVSTDEADDSTPADINVSSGETVTCTFVNDELPPEPGEIIVEKVVNGEPSTFEFTFDTVGFDLADNMLAGGESSSSGDLAPGDGYGVSEQVPDGWTLVSASCDDGSDPDNIELSAGETVTCTFVNEIGDSVRALILVDIEAVCVLDGNDGVGVIEVSMSIPGGAQVVVRDSDGDVVGTFFDDGEVEVPEDATYTWEATANEGFEFASDFTPSGSLTIEECSNPETLPFTGMNTGPLALIAATLAMLGGLVLLATRDPREN